MLAHEMRRPRAHSWQPIQKPEAFGTIMKSISRRTFVATTALMSMGWCSPIRAQGAASPRETATLFQNVRIFDGRSATLSPPSNVLVKGNIIERISTSPITVENDIRVITAGGRVLMPGLTDMHWHAMLVRP